MIFIKYLDVYDSYYDDEGNVVQELIQQNYTLPVDMDPKDFTSISPFFSKKGKLFKNVSIIDDRYGKTYKVVGNYKKLKEMIDNPTRNKLGYGK